jgi:integrase
MNTVYPIKDKEKIQQMKSALLRQNYRNFMIFELGIHIGRRVTDILEMKVGDIRGKSHIQIEEDKTGKKIPLVVNEDVYNEVIRYCAGMDDGEYLFPSKKRSKSYEPDCKGRTPIDRVQMWRDVKAAAEQCGIEEIGTHSIRKTFGYHFYKQTGDLAMLQKLFGHRSPMDTLRYIGIQQEEIDEKLSNFRLAG